MDWQGWLDTWDRQQLMLLPDREERFTAMFDLIEAVVGKPRAMLDLAGGPGSITVRLRRRFPAATVTLLDVDPSLLAIARGVLGGDRQVRVVEADLAETGWVDTVARPIDAVVTANSLHWLDESTLRRVYREVAQLIRPGGVLCNADPMPPEGAQTLIAAIERYRHDRRVHPRDALDWEHWWGKAAAEPALAPLVARRNRRFGGKTHPPDFTPPLRWHREALHDAGFREAGCIWRHGDAAVVAALK